MKIAVCMKRVPDSAAKVAPAGDGKTINPQGIETIINPYDEFALEEAIRTRDKFPGSEAVVVSVDPDGDQTVMRKALAMGADRGIVVKGGRNFDGYGTAILLAGVLKDLNCDIIFCGKQAIDDDSLQVPSIIAHILGIPRVNVVTKLEITEKKAVAYRDVEGGKETYEVNLPAIFAAQKGLNDPRYPTLKGIMTAKAKRIDVVNASSFEERINVIKLTIPPTRPPGKIVGKGTEAVAELVRLLKEEAKVL